MYYVVKFWVIRVFYLPFFCFKKFIQVIIINKAITCHAMTTGYTLAHRPSAHVLSLIFGFQFVWIHLLNQAHPLHLVSPQHRVQQSHSCQVQDLPFTHQLAHHLLIIHLYQYLHRQKNLQIHPQLKK